MTMPEEVELQETESSVSVQEGSYYIVDLARGRDLNRSLVTMLLARRCPSCKARLQADMEEPTEQEHIKEITGCCSNQEGFIRPDMPMQEIIFRSVLSQGNQPISLERLHYLVTDRWYTPNNPRNISISGLKRVLDSDMYYGFNEVSRATTES